MASCTQSINSTKKIVSKLPRVASLFYRPKNNTPPATLLLGHWGIAEQEHPPAESNAAVSSLLDDELHALKVDIEGEQRSRSEDIKCWSAKCANLSQQVADFDNVNEVLRGANERWRDRIVKIEGRRAASRERRGI